jgi:hypothetical protein
MIEFFLFEHDPDRARIALGWGVNHFLVDWEVTDKAERQKGYDTEIRPGTPESLAALATLPQARPWCRINALSPDTPAELESALECGAAGLMLPMVRSPRELETFLRLLNGRAASGFLVEHVEALTCLGDLASLGADRVYFGLNDFAISRGDECIFQALADGSVDRAREAFAHTPFGVAGMTAVDAGDPLPAHLLLAELARLRCAFTFLRRSFRRDTRDRDPGAVVAGIRAAWESLTSRNTLEILRDRETLVAHLTQSLNPSFSAPCPLS